MLPIQIFILLLLAFSLLLSILVLRNRVFGRLFFGVQFFVGVIFVLVPDLSQRLAVLLGVGRGTDFLLYMLIFSGVIMLILGILGGFNVLMCTALMYFYKDEFNKFWRF